MTQQEIEVNNMFMSMQKAYNMSPCLYGGKKGFKYRMSNFTFNLLIEECKKITTANLNNVTEFMGVPIELDNAMPDNIFHLYDNNKIENL